jgi:hypothetical protein
VTEPSVLTRLVKAIDAVRAGRGESKTEGAGKKITTLDGFSFLLRAP